MSALRALIRPTLFTFVFCETCHTAATIYQYENRKFVKASINDWFTRQSDRAYSNFTGFRKSVNDWKNSLTPGQKLAYSAVFINSLVFAASRIPRMHLHMDKYFTLYAPATKTSLSSMILSSFSHVNLLHLGFNMFALISFANVTTAYLGPEHTVALYLSSGAVSSLATVAFRTLSRTSAASMGASGALFGIVAYCCVRQPESTLLLMGIPIEAGNAIKLLMAVDTIGLIAKWRYLDHAAHLGGALFGLWYAKWGERMVRNNKEDIIKIWVSLRGKE